MSEKDHKLRILLVDDEADFRKVTGETLEMKGFHVVEASDGKEALSIMGIQTFDVILSDIKMPKLHGIDLLHRVNKDFSHIPLILMTGFSDIIEVKEAYEIGASGFLSKPFNFKDLDETLLSVLGERYEKMLEKEDEKAQLRERDKVEESFCQIQIEEFIMGSKIAFPIFLKLSNKKFVKLANQGEDLSADMLKKLKNKNVQCLYLKNEDFKKYLAFNTKLGHALSKSHKVDTKRKTRFYNQTFKQIVKFGHKQYVDEDVFNIAKKNLEVVVDMYTNNLMASDLLDELMNVKGDLFEHAVGVNMLATMIAREMDWTSSEKLFLVSVSALFHDIGKKNLSPEILEKEPFEFTDEERKEYEKHPEVGAEIIKELGMFPDGTDQIVIHHHECVDGSGFPNGFGRVKIHPVAKIIHLADEFIHVNNALRVKSKRVTPEQVVDELEVRKAEFESEHFAALERVFKLKKTRKQRFAS